LTKEKPSINVFGRKPWCTGEGHSPKKEERAWDMQLQSELGPYFKPNQN